MSDWIGPVLAILIGVGCMVFGIHGCVECEAKGGQYVKRFVGGYTCIEGREIQP